MKDGLSLEKPKSIWNRDLKLNIRPVFAGLTKAVINTIALDAKEAASSIVEVAESIGLDSKPEEIAFKLIKDSLLDALLSLTRESVSYLNPDEVKIEALNKAISEKLGNTSIKIDQDFFEYPGGSCFLQDIKEMYSLWLERIGATKEAANSISQRLPSYFVYSIASEWRSNQKLYQVLAEISDSPFSLAERREDDWLLYFSYLKRRTNENIFDEPFGLSQIYVKLNAYYVKKAESCDEVTLTSDAGNAQRICVDLAEELSDWLSVGDKHDPLRVISGGPGSGKSSFTKIFCRDVAEKGLAKPIYIPLHLIDPTREITSEVERFVRDEGLLAFNPLDTSRKEDKLLIVFDGLDELASMGKVAAQVARDFVIAVERMLERRNLGSNPIFALISGREVIVQENETEFRRPRQLLTILPYWMPETDRLKYGDPKNLLNEDLRDKWWTTYGELIGADYAGLPRALRTSEINEITSQPLLNYLVALSYKRGKLNFNKKLNLNSVYADLVQAVHERGYEKSRTYRPISHVNFRDFLRVLEEVGLAAWHSSDGRSTSVREIMSHCRQSGLESLLKSFTEGAEAGVTKLLAAFFFRRNGEVVGDDAAFVFTHKSFGEYLTAMRLVRGLDRVINERKRRINDPDDGMDVVDALAFWLKLAGPAPLTKYLQLFLSREISQYSVEKLEEWQSILCELCSHAIEKMMPVERIGNLNFLKSVSYDANASTALIISLNACAVALKKVSDLTLSSNISIGNFLRRVCPQRTGPRSPLLYTALSYMNFSNQCLDMADLYGANLENSLLDGVVAHFTTFSSANLRNVSFVGANVGWSRFEGGALHNTNFKESYMRDCVIEGNVVACNFNGSKLNGVTAESASFRKCSFTSACIDGVRFKPGKLNECDFEGAYVGPGRKAMLKWYYRGVESGDIVGAIQFVGRDEVMS